MPVNLQLCISQKENTKPYKFKITGINVYSFEEALFHCHHYWKQSIDDFLSNEFIDWVGSALDLAYIASKIKALSKLSKISLSLAAFLSLTDYFSDQEIEKLKKEIFIWENRNEWEKLKERGDFLMNSNNPERACNYYKKALEYDENAEILNNIAISLMKTGNYGEARKYLRRAGSIKPRDFALMTHLAEACILDGDFDAAQVMLKDIKDVFGNKDEIYYYNGEICFHQGNYSEAVYYYEKIISADIEQDTDYIYRLSEAYGKLGYYEKALGVLENINMRGKYFYKKQAELYAEAENFSAAAKFIERALDMDKNSVALRIKLAMYHRMNCDYARAEAAIAKAFELSPQNPHANLEDALIKKSLGRLKEYQTILHEILESFTTSYRFNEAEIN